MTDRPNVSMIGASIVIKGELSADEDLVIEGQVEGNISLNQNVLTVGEHGKVKAKIAAKTVVVVGKVWDSIIAAENVDIRDTSLVEGDIPPRGWRWPLGPMSAVASTYRSRKAEGPRRAPPTAEWTCRTNHARSTLRSRSPAGLFRFLQDAEGIMAPTVSVHRFFRLQPPPA